tara:strand:+ start:1708 stop:3396 length:1689 start_codon:yes stop_codon:yes gene_type:complete
MDKVSNTFKLPIEYTKCIDTQKHVIDDLELDNIYSSLFKNKSKLGEITSNKWLKYYSNNKDFLKKQQSLLKYFSNVLDDNNIKLIKNNIEIADRYYDKWSEFKSHQDFLTKFQFVDWKHLSFLNSHPFFLQIITYYNFASPLFHILMPIILLLIPFIVIKIVMKIPFTFQMYKDLLGASFKNHAFGKLCNAFFGENCGEISINTKIYAVASIVLYVFTFYQNIMSCIKYYKNTCLINEFLYDTNQFIESCNTTHNIIDPILKKYNLDKFRKHNLERMRELNNLSNCVKKDSFSIKNVTKVGSMMFDFHNLYDNHSIDETLSYWFGFNGFIDNLFSLKERIHNKNLSICKFTKCKNTFFMKDLSYIEQKDSIKNDISLDKNIIITGPNASGKTTILKSVCINVLLSQQIGYGFYSSFKFKPFDNIQSYINIPDTSGRDSLFQAESRRCLNIIDYIKKNPNNSVFCIFDELFSGTNPYEAQKSAIAYLKYLHKYKIKYLLTTHFEKLSQLKDNNCKQQYMNVNVDSDNTYHYTYKILNGTSKVFGGFKVLRDLGFPNEIINLLY